VFRPSTNFIQFHFSKYRGCPIYLYDPILICNILEFLPECSLCLAKLFFTWLLYINTKPVAFALCDDTGNDMAECRG
jgi:hypothetical protein